MSKQESMFLPGENYIVRTVTHYYTGRLVRLSKQWLVLEDAAWIADTGRWSTAPATGALSEVEPYPDGRIAINAGAIVDVSGWAHKLPRDTR